MIVADSSVVVAGFASWHEAHEVARDALARASRPVAHALLESYSVLTRLPPPHRADGSVVAEFIDAALTRPPLVPSGELAASLPRRLAGLGIAGGAVYDGSIALTAAEAGAILVTCDRRASETYRRCGVEFEQLAV